MVPAVSSFGSARAPPENAVPRPTIIAPDAASVPSTDMLAYTGPAQWVLPPAVVVPADQITIPIPTMASPPTVAQPPLDPRPGLGSMLLRPDIPRRIPSIFASDVRHSMDVTLAQREAALDRAPPGPNEQYIATPPPPVPI